ncbi:DUF423 domain-containing protein [Flavobacterium sp.]|uniref:DUF423 domain-containing protein n=1 Tax=Flavobacterium sp. TaxID=239 RepID=UPI00286E012C|nr:DUF423 domain-containing protein [Flavobacterium sp.]
MDKKITLTALVFGFVSIVLGAFGAHTLKKILEVDQLSSFETGVKFMMYHALFLLFIATNQLIDSKQKKIIYSLVLFGTILFSFSIFLLTTTAITGINFKFVGPITPIGGLFLIFSWGVTFYYIVVKKS